MSRRYLWLAAALAALAACEKAQEEIPVSVEAMTEEPIPSKVVANMFDRLEPATGDPWTIGADYGGTRAHIEMNEEGTFATSVWQAGDSFSMYAFNLKTGSGQIAPFSTEESGASVNFTTSHGLGYDPPYYTLFPGTKKFSLYNDGLLFGENIPAEQEAVPGGIKDGYTVAYTATQSKDDFLHFQNMVSLVRFRMSGSLVSQVKTVTIKGAKTLAGDIAIAVAADGSAEVTRDTWFTNDERSTTVTLTGDFVAGQDYYIVLEPGEQPRFQMVFADDEGHSTTRTGIRFTFPQGRISDFGTIDLGSEFTDDPSLFAPVQYMTASAGAPKPVTIAVLPDGFTAEQLDDYVSLAKSGIDALMATEPYKSYKNYFNVWILKAPSMESGANVTDGSGNITTPVECYFGSRWGATSYGDMSADDAVVFDFVSQNCPDVKNGIHTLEEVPVLLIINDSRYGGICRSYSNGQGYGMVPYTYEGGPMSWSYPNLTPSTNDPLPQPVTNAVMQANYHWTTSAEYEELGRNQGDWRNTLVHEFGGHCFGRLGDEYWPNGQMGCINGAVNGHTWPVPFSLNLAASPTAVPWQADILDYPLADLVSKDPNYGRVGAFQGGGHYLYGRWRNEMISCMIDNRFYFSAWQRMLIVRRIMSLSGSTFDAASFWAKDVTTDPVRDINSSPVIGDSPVFAPLMPMLPPPVLINVSEP